MADQQRAFQSGVGFSLFGGMMTMTADVVPIRRPNADKSTIVTCCPDCAEGGKMVRVREQFFCEIDPKHGPFKRGEGAKGREVGDDEYEPVGIEELAAAREPDLPEKELTLGIFPVAEIESFTRPDGFGYRVRPGKVGTSMKAYGILMAILEKGEYALVAEANFKSSQKPYRLMLWEGQLVLQSLVRPDDLAERETIEAEMPDKRTMTAVAAWLAENAEAFEPERFRNLRRERLEALGGEGTIIAMPKKPAAEPEFDLAAQLEASLAAVPKRATAAKKAATKKAAPKLKAVS